jgi:hypothetical protein
MPKRKSKRKATATKTPKLTPRQQREKRSAAARKAAHARWSGERPLSKAQQRKQLSRVPTAELTVEHYADRDNPRLSWAAAVLKRKLSTKAQRLEAARVFKELANRPPSPWSNLPAAERSEIARRGGVRRWEIWREEQARKEGKTKKADAAKASASIVGESTDAAG